MPRVGEDIYVCGARGCGARVQRAGHAYVTVAHDSALICTTCHQVIDRERTVA